MEINQYVKEVERTRAKLELPIFDVLHMLMGIITEAGELTDVYKKNLAYKKQIDIPNVREEIGDIMWYLANFCSLNGFDLEQILQNNVDKLKARYPEKFTEEKAISRDLETERKILESY